MKSLTQSHFKQGPVTTICLSVDSTVLTAECEASSMCLAQVGGHGIRWTRIHACCLGVADIFENNANFDIQLAKMQISPKIGPLGRCRCTYDWQNCCSSRKLFRSIPPPIANVNNFVDSTTLGVSETQLYIINILQKWEMCYMELVTFEHLPLVKCSEDM